MNGAAPWQVPDEPPELRALPPIDEEVVEGEVEPPVYVDWRDALEPGQLEAMTLDQVRGADHYWWVRLSPAERAEKMAEGRDVLARLEVQESTPTLAEELQAFVDAHRDELGPDHAGTAAGMIFPTARELFATVPAETSFRVAGLVPDAALTELDGAAKKAGKTTFVAHMVRAVLDGEPFLGRATRRGAVVVLSEQPVASLRASFAGAGLLERDDLRILTWHNALGRPWREVVAAAVEACAQSDAGLLVVDTLPQWAGLRGDAENDAGAALEAIAPLQAAAAAGLTILVVRHDRKGSGEVGESARGSSAFGGAVDVILQLRRGGPEERPTIRYLAALSRFPETPEQLVIELANDSGGAAGMNSPRYVELGDVATYTAAAGKQAVLVAIGDAELRRAEIESASGISGERLTVLLAELVEAGYLERAGRGVKGDPQRFRRMVPIHSGGSPTTWDPPVGMKSAGDEPGPTGLAATEPGTMESVEPGEPTEPEPTEPSEPETGAVTVACSDYAAHQLQHRQVEGRWVCPACEPEDAPWI